MVLASPAGAVARSEIQQPTFGVFGATQYDCPFDVDRPRDGRPTHYSTDHDSPICAYDAPAPAMARDNGVRSSQPALGWSTEGVDGLVWGDSALRSGNCDAAKNEHRLLQRALTDRRLNPERGSIGGGGLTGRTTGHGADRL